MCSFSDLCALASIDLLMVPVSSLGVVSSHFAEEGTYSQQQQYLDLIRPGQVEEVLFGSCLGKSTEASDPYTLFYILKSRRVM